MCYTVYILESKQSGRYYIGQTKDLAKRLSEHNRGRCKSTRSGIPWDVIYTEVYESRELAYNQEKRIKNKGAGRFLKELGRGVV
ncbi:MAG: hypothetical protein Kow0068_24730 [Marinilabiliales bacterium]